MPTVKVAESPLVMAGACWMVIGQRLLRRAVSVVADSGTAYVPAVVGVPARVAVPSPLSVKVSPGGRLDQPSSAPGIRWS